MIVFFFNYRSIIYEILSKEREKKEEKKKKEKKRKKMYGNHFIKKIKSYIIVLKFAQFSKSIIQIFIKDVINVYVLTCMYS